MAEKRKMFRKKRFKRLFFDSFENYFENDFRLKTVVKEVVIREEIWKRFTRTTDDDSDDSDDTTDDNDFLGFDANSSRIQEMLQKRWQKRIKQLNGESKDEKEKRVSLLIPKDSEIIPKKKTILRKARLEISSKTLQKIRRAHQMPTQTTITPKESNITTTATTTTTTTTMTTMKMKTTTTRSGEKCRSGQPGYITCAICETTKYYSHVQRRYGVFSCEPCSKFFARFLRNPLQLFCLKEGKCLIKLSSNSSSNSRCRACWLNQCLQTFQMESQIKEEIGNRFKPKLSSKSSVIPLSVSVTSSSSSQKKTKKSSQRRKRESINSEPLLMVAQQQQQQSGPRVKRVCRRTVKAGLPLATFSSTTTTTSTTPTTTSRERTTTLKDDNSDDDSDELPVDVYLCRAVAAQQQQQQQRQQ